MINQPDADDIRRDQTTVADLISDAGDDAFEPLELEPIGEVIGEPT